MNDLIPRLDTLQALALSFAVQLGGFQVGRTDDTTASIWAEFLRSYSSKVLEHKYPDLPCAEGAVLPVMTDMDPGAEEHIYYSIESGGYADWIADDGTVAPNSWISTGRHVGYASEMSAGYSLNFFELEKAAFAAKGMGPKISIDATKSKQDRRNHEAKTDWTWAFGDTDKRLIGLFNHPNITVTMAPLNAGASSRLPENKTNDEIAADVAELIQAVPRQTLGQHFVSEVWVSRPFMELCMNRRLGAGDGLLSLWQYLVDRHKGDETGQGKVSFRVLNYCDPLFRRHPKYNDDRSGISGEFMFAVSKLDKDEAHFKRARSYTQLPPERKGFNTFHQSHSKIGGAVIKRPLAFHRFDFGTV